MSQIAFAPDVFTWPDDEPRLIGGRCTQCSAIVFPKPPSCARCGSVDIERHLLASTGTLWTFTTQGFLPKEPYLGGETNETFVPFGVGIVELGDEVRVESRLTENDPGKLMFGMPMELVIIPLRANADGSDVMTFAFAPVAAPGADSTNGNSNGNSNSVGGH